MAINTTTLEANLTTKINATSGTTDGKEFLLLGKAVEALTIPSSVAEMTAAGTTQVAAVNAAGTTQVAAVNAAGSGYAALKGATFTGNVDFGSNKITYSNNYAQLSDLPSASTYHGMFAHVHATGKGYYAHAGNWLPIVNEDTSGNVTIGGNLTVSGTTTTVNSTTLNVADKNITVANGAADAAAANGAGLTVAGASATFNYASSGDKWTTNKGLDVGGTLEIDEVIETVGIGTTASGAQDFDLATRSVIYITANQTANRSINFRGDGSTTLNNMMSVGQSISCAALMTQGSSAYYLNSYNVDGTSVTPKWQGGSAPTSGNASGIDVYTFTLIKTAANTFTVLATLAAFA